LQRLAYLLLHTSDSLPTSVDRYPSDDDDFDLAADYATGNYSGVNIAGLVRCAGSIALSRARKDGTGVQGLLITLNDVKKALKEVKK